MAIAWQRGTLLVDGHGTSLSLSRDRLLMAAHNNFDKPEQREEILNDVSVVDKVDTYILKMMRSEKIA